jgi:hypothetical protein
MSASGGIVGGGGHSHIWRSKGLDTPCTPTGVEQSDENLENGRVYAQVRTPEGDENFVPKDELITVAAQKAEQNKAAKPANVGNGAAGPDALQPNPTASVAFLRAIIPAGPWALTSIVPDGVTRTKAFEATDEMNAIEFIMSENAAGKGLYYTSADCGRPISKPAKGDLIGARLLHVDSDPRDDETVEDAKTRALAAYRAHDRPPSYIVDSGNGLQAGWLLSRTFRFPQIPPGPYNSARKNASRPTSSRSRIAIERWRPRSARRLARITLIDCCDCPGRSTGRTKPRRSSVEFRAWRVSSRSPAFATHWRIFPPKQGRARAGRTSGRAAAPRVPPRLFMRERCSGVSARLTKK